MATTTPNYGWDVPTSTDYVKDGATAIETLGDDIDASLFSITGGKNVGAQYISTTTFTGVSAFTVSGCFTSAYDNYMILLNVTSGSINTEIRMQLDASGTPSSASYAYNRTGSTGTGASNEGSNSTSYVPVIFVPGSGAIASTIFVSNPQDAVFTTFSNTWLYDDGGTLIQGTIGARHRVATSYNGIRFFNPASMTGTVKVYGLRD